MILYHYLLKERIKAHRRGTMSCTAGWPLFRGTRLLLFLVVLVPPIAETRRTGSFELSCGATREYVSFGRWTSQDYDSNDDQGKRLSMTIGTLAASSIPVSAPEPFETSRLDLVFRMERIKRLIQKQKNELLHRASVLLSRLKTIHGSIERPKTIDDSPAEINRQTAREIARLEGITKPLIAEEIWEQLTGTEFQEHPKCINELARMGEQVARVDASDDWIDWTVFGSLHGSLESGNIHVWIGRAKQEGYGSQIPFVKTRSVVPLTVDEMVSLLMDSDRVKTYNPWSLGRRDCWVSEHDPNGYAKIVKNRSQPPLGSKAMVSTTLLHARPLEDPLGAWLIVSRAVGGHVFREPDDESAGQFHLLLGVNLLEPHTIESCALTAVTHVYSSALPLLLAQRLGVKSAVKFVKDIRAVKVAAR